MSGKAESSRERKDAREGASFLLGVPGLLLAAALCAVLGCPNVSDDHSPDMPGGRHRGSSAISDVRTNAMSRASARKRGADGAGKPGAGRKSVRLPPQLLQGLMETAAETGNKKAIQELSAEYRRNPDPKARMEFVEALLSIDRAGIMSLASFASDPDSEVSERATTVLESQIDIVEDAYLRSSLLGQVIASLRDEESLRPFCAKLSALPSGHAVRRIVEIVEREKSNPVAAKLAKEAYETITGEKFRSVKAANRWARMAER